MTTTTDLDRIENTYRWVAGRLHLHEASFFVVPLETLWLLMGLETDQQLDDFAQAVQDNECEPWGTGKGVVTYVYGDDDIPLENRFTRADLHFDEYGLTVGMVPQRTSIVPPGADAVLTLDLGYAILPTEVLIELAGLDPDADDALVSAPDGDYLTAADIRRDDNPEPFGRGAGHRIDTDTDGVVSVNVPVSEGWPSDLRIWSPVRSMTI